MFLYQKIQYLRLEKGLSKYELAKISNTSGTHIRLLEQGKRRNPRISTIIKLAKAFNLTVDELLEGTEYDLRKNNTGGERIE